jgi:plastocyanin
MLTLYHGPVSRSSRIIWLLQELAVTDYPIAITDIPLQSETSAAPDHEVTVDNFSFSPATVSVMAGTTITWTNRDDVPHTVMSAERKFKSRVLDTDERFSYRFDAPGEYPYFCSIHPKMTGRVVVG